MNYKLVEDGVIRSDGASIPATEENKDWVAFQAWVAAGNTPISEDQPIPPDFFNN